jgi:cell division protein FtsI/penicillin-binding protein 2
MRTGVLVAVTVAVAAAVATVAFLVLGGADGPGPEGAAGDYLEAWSGEDFEAMAALVDRPPPGFEEVHAAVTRDLRITAGAFELGEVTSEDGEARAAFTATLTIAGLGDWRYDSVLPLRQAGDDEDWLVAWSPAVVHPQLADGLRLGRERNRPERAPILDRNGQPLAAKRPAVTIGIQPQRTNAATEVTAVLAEHLGVAPIAVERALAAPGVQPDHFVPIVTIHRARYDEVRPALHPVPGILFRETEARLAPSDGFAQHVLGRTGEITAEGLEQLGATYQVGDVVGLTGLEARFERELAGVPSGRIVLVDSAAADALVDVLHVFPGTAGTPVATTVDPVVQAAVEQSLDGVDGPAAVVVLDAGGRVAASASRPLADDLNRAFAGVYAPGSTFKVVTTAALLEEGTTAATPMECPAETNVGGKVFRNFEGESLGTVPFSDVFAHSCNTAFVTAVEGLPDGALAAAAARFGFGTEYSLGLTTSGGVFPDPADGAERAAAAIGQARVTASPLHIASVAVAVPAGSWRPPVLLPETSDPAAPAPGTIDSTVTDQLTQLMALVVTDGTGTAAAVPGRRVAGKTGTAEFGTGSPLPTHAWFIGFTDGLGFAVLVEGGGVGGEVAAPIAGRLVAALPDP